MINKLFTKHLKKLINKNLLIMFFIRFLKDNNIKYDTDIIYNFFKDCYFIDIDDIYPNRCYYYDDIIDNTLIRANFHLFSTFYRYVSTYYKFFIVEIDELSILNRKWHKSYSKLIILLCKKYNNDISYVKFLQADRNEITFSELIYRVKRFYKRTYKKAYKLLKLDKTNKFFYFLYCKNIIK